MELVDIKLELTEHHEKHSESDFTSELAKAYFELEFDNKKRRLDEYSKAYEQIEDKNSFNAQYLETLIDVLIIELNK